MKRIFLLFVIFYLLFINALAQEAGITNPVDGLVIDRYNFDTYISGTRTCTFDGWANPGNIDIYLYVNGSSKSYDCNNCGTWYITQDIDAGTNEIYLESRKDFDPLVESSRRSITFMKPLNASDFYLTYPGDSYIRIKWYKHTGTDTENFFYRVYRNTVDEVFAGDNWLALGEWTQNNTYDDYTAEIGTTYYYWVVCAINNIGSNPSAFGTSVQSGDPFPVELISFTAGVINNSVELKWQTATEINNYGFDIERISSNSEKWSKIGFVQGHGNSSSPNNYSFTNAPNDGTEFQYRLKQIDLDGQFEYSPVVEVSLDIPIDFSIKQNYPNPFNPSTQISYSIPKTSLVDLRIYDILGREVAQLVNETQDEGKYTVNFNASELAGGVYIFTIRTNDFHSSKKMIVLK